MIYWDYCQVDWHVGDKKPRATIYTTTDTTEKVIEEGASYLEVFYKLGLDGWEMCGTLQDEGSTDIFYFKRPIDAG